MTRLSAFLLFALVAGGVVSPPRALAATVPMLFAYDVTVRATPTLRAKRSEPPCDGARVLYDGPSNPPVTVGAQAIHAYGPALELLEWRELVEGRIYAAPAATVAAEGLTSTEFQVADRVAGQLADVRLGSLAGKISPEQLQQLANNPNALRFLDTATGNTNIAQVAEGRLLRITTAADDPTKIISVGPIQRNGLFNGITNGRFEPVVE